MNYHLKFAYLYNKKIKFLRKYFSVNVPNKCDILIYNKTLSENITVNIPRIKNIFVLDTSEIIFYLNLKFFFNLFIYFFNKETLFIDLKFGFKRNLLRIIKDSLDFAIINLLEPKLVITYVDNHSRFGRLSKRFKKIRFIAIQNGLRPKWESKERIIHDIYLAFNQNQRIELKKLGWVINEFYNIGSLNAARQFSKLKYEKKKRDLLIVSGWRGNVEIDLNYQEQFKAMEEMHIFLNKIIKKEKYNVEIILRAKKNGEHWFINKYGINEEEYYKKIYGKNCKLIYYGKSHEDIYKEINKSHLCLTNLSTSVFEAFLYSHNGVFLNFHEDNFFFEGLPNEIVLSKFNLEFMEFRIKELIIDGRKRSEEIHKKSKIKANETLMKVEEIIRQKSI